MTITEEQFTEHYRMVVHNGQKWYGIANTRCTSTPVENLPRYERGCPWCGAETVDRQCNPPPYDEYHWSYCSYICGTHVAMTTPYIVSITAPTLVCKLVTASCSVEDVI